MHEYRAAARQMRAARVAALRSHWKDARMTLPDFTSEDFIWVRVVASGDDCNLYAPDRNSRALRLAGVHRVEIPRPVDLAVVSDSAPDGEDELPVLLLSHRAIPPDCLVSMRPLGLLTIRCQAQVQEVVVAVPGADDGLAAWREFSDLSEDQRTAVAALARALYGGREDSTLVWAGSTRAPARSSTSASRQRGWHRLDRQRAGRLRQSGNRWGTACWAPAGHPKLSRIAMLSMRTTDFQHASRNT